MRILKEYSALVQEKELTDENSIELNLLPGNNEAAVNYIERCAGDIDYKTLNAMKIAAGGIFDILAKNAGVGETTRIACSYHKYYYMLAFEFSEAALPLHTLNKSAKVLGMERGREKEGEDFGFMNIIHLVNRFTLSVDKITEKMRISIIKEKRYSIPKVDKDASYDLPLLTGPYRLAPDKDVLAEDFSKRIFHTFGLSADKFLISPQLFRDNLEIGELSGIFLEDVNGNCGGGAVWQKTYGIIVLMVISVFAPLEQAEDYEKAKRLLQNGFEKAVQESGASFVVSKIGHSELIADYFEFHDEVYNYKPTTQQKRQTSYIKPDLMPLIKKSYKNFELNRDVREINYNYRSYEPYSVLTAIIDAAASEAVLSVLWFGDDLKSNLIRHIIALKKIGIRNIYFRLDLGEPEEAAVSDLVQSCGFEAQYLWPYSSDKGDIVIFSYYESSVYEMKPCEISPLDKTKTVKVPELVESVYGDNYPSQYLYHPEELKDKIRKRHVYPFIAIDDGGKAAGMISFVKLSANPYLFEIGQLMVKPEHRGTNVANQLIEYLYDTAIHRLDFDAILSESVTNHKFSQRSCISSGFCDTALKLNIMSADAFELEAERRRIGRMSCVVSCIERADETFTVYLPAVYEEQIKFCFQGLKPRQYEISNDTLPLDGSMTEYQMNDDEAMTSQLINVTFRHIGSDIESVIDKLEGYARNKGIKSMLINLPLSDACNSSALKLLKERKFFFGGIIPYWLPESDALFMQKLYGNTPDWDSIKLFSRKIKKIANMIKEDMEGAE